MTALIAQLRRLAAVSVGDVTVGGETYWTDDQLEDVLDRRRTEYRGVGLGPIMGTPAQTTYTDYLLPTRDLEYDALGGADGFTLLDSTGAAAPAHTVDVSAGLIVFDADTGGASFYLDYRTYDLNAAAADVWEMKASFVASAVDWRSDNHQISASQEYEHCMKRAREFRSKAGGGLQVVELWRSDEAWHS